MRNVYWVLGPLYFSLLVLLYFALACCKGREESKKQRGMAVVRHQIKEKVRMTSKMRGAGREHNG